MSYFNVCPFDYITFVFSGEIFTIKADPWYIWLEPTSSKLEIGGSTADNNFSIFFLILAFFACLIAEQSDYEWNQAWYAPSQYPILAREWYMYVFVGSLTLFTSKGEGHRLPCKIKKSNIQW